MHHSQFVVVVVDGTCWEFLQNFQRMETVVEWLCFVDIHKALRFELDT